MSLSTSPFSRLTAKIFLSVVGLLLILVLLLPTHLGVKTMLKIAENFVNIEYTGVEGSLYSTLSIERLWLEYPGGNVEIKEVTIDISVFKLFDRTAQINSASVQSIVVNQSEVEDTAPEEPQSKAYIETPVTVDVNNIEIQSFVLNQGDKPQLSFSSLDLNQLGLSESTLSIHDLSFGTITLFSTQAEQDVSNANEATNDDKTWLSQLEQAPTIVIPEVFIPINLDVERLYVGQLQQRVEGETAETLLSDVVLTTEIKGQQVALSVSTFANALLTGTQTQINGKIDLAENYQHQLNLMLVHNQQYLKSSLEGDLHQQKIVVEDSENKLIDVDIESAIDAGNLPLSIDLQAQDITPVFRFVAMQAPQVQIESFVLGINGDWTSGYQITSKGQMAYIDNTTEKETQSIAQLNGDITVKPAEYALHIDNYNISGDLGSLRVDGQSNVLRDTSDIEWQSKYAIIINELQASKLHQALPELMSGKVNLSANVTENSASGGLLCEDVNATLNAMQLNILCDLDLSEQGELSIDTFAASLGENIIKGSGNLSLPSSAIWTFNEQWLEQMDASLEVDLSASDLSQLMSSLGGRAEADLTIKGQLLKPRVELSASANEVRFDGISVQQASVQGSANGVDNWQSEIVLDANALSINQQVIDTSRVALIGDAKQQTLNIDIDGQNWRTKQSFNANLQDMQDLFWEGTWNEGMFQYEDYVLTKDDDTAFSFNAKTLQVSLAGHCWTETIASAEFCTKALLYKDNSVDIDTTLFLNVGTLLHEFQPDVFEPGSELPLKSTIKGSYSRAQGIEIASANLMQGTILTTNHTLDVSAIVANISATQDNINTVVFAGTEQTGRVGLSSTLALQDGAYMHSGNLAINDLQLSLLQRFAPAINQLQGDVNAGIKFEGELIKPDLSGEAIINNGALTLDAYTYPLTQFEQTIVFDKKVATTEGRFRLGEGDAAFTAKVDFDSNLSVSGTVKGHEMEIAYKNFDLTTSPDITFAVSPELIDLDGKIVIDATSIKVDDLPESVRSPSSDVIVIGQKPSDPVVPIGLDIDLQVLVDPEQSGSIEIDALGLEATLAGELDLKVDQLPGAEENTFQPMQTYLTGYLQVLDGAYNAWGQALQIKAGSIYFDGEPSLPQFILSAIRNPLNTEGDVIVGIRASGNPIVPKIELFSNPIMEQARQISYLLRGQDLTGDSQGGLETGLINILVGFGVGKNENRVAALGKALGFDSLNVQAAGQGVDTQVQVTGKVSEDLQITYAVGVFDAASEVILKYQILPKLYIEATGGLNNALDLFYEFTRGSMVTED